MRTRKLIILTSTALGLAFFCGVLMGPWIRTVFWSTALRVAHDPWKKLLAADHLEGTAGGRRLLYEFVKTGDEETQSICVTVLANEVKPWSIYSLLPRFREEKRMAPYHDVLNAMDYAEQHRQVLGALRYESHHCTNEVARQKIKSILEAFSVIKEE
jgi:hypothetical protein